MTLDDVHRRYGFVDTSRAVHDFNSPIPWVQVRQALEEIDLPETIYHVAGTEVAFLHKQDG